MGKIPVRVVTSGAGGMIDRRFGFRADITAWSQGMCSPLPITQAEYTALGGGPDTIAPSIVSASIPGGGTTIVLTYDETLLASGDGIPDTADYTITASGGAATVSARSVVGSQVTLTTSRTILSGETVTLDYTAGASGRIQDAANNISSNFSGRVVSNNSVADVTAPTLTSATIPTTGDTISLLFNEPVVIGAGGNSGFTIAMSGGAVTLAYLSGSGNDTLIYGLSRTINSGETCSDFDYTQPGSGVEDIAGNDLATFTNQQAKVTNNSIVGAGTIGTPAIVSLISADDSGRSNSDNITSDTTPGLIVSLPLGYGDDRDVAVGDVLRIQAGGSDFATVTLTQNQIDGIDPINLGATFSDGSKVLRCRLERGALLSDWSATKTIVIDTTAATLTSPTGTETGETTATLTVAHDETNGGTLYWVADVGSTPSAAQVKAGQDSGGGSADASGSVTDYVSGASIEVTGLTGSTAYKGFMVYEDAAGNLSTVSATSTFTTDAGAGDSYYSFVKALLANTNAADASTTFVDQSSIAATVTVAGNAQFDTAQAPTGMTSSALFDGTGDRLSLPQGTAYNCGTGDFVLEAWVRFNSFAHTYNTVVGLFPDSWSAGHFHLQVQSNGTLHYGGAGGPIRSSSSGAISTGTWYHIAIARTSGTSSLYIDGTRVSTGSDSNNWGSSENGRFRVGDNYAASEGVDGWICSARLTIGSNRGYTGATITVPTLPLPASA